MLLEIVMQIKFVHDCNQLMFYLENISLINNYQLPISMYKTSYDQFTYCNYQKQKETNAKNRHYLEPRSSCLPDDTQTPMTPDLQWPSRLHRPIIEQQWPLNYLPKAKLQHKRIYNENICKAIILEKFHLLLKNKTKTVF